MLTRRHASIIYKYVTYDPAEAMKNLFEKFGKVLECQIIQDPVTKRSRLAWRSASVKCVYVFAHLQKQPVLCVHVSICMWLYSSPCRGFGFVTFEDQESVRGVLDAHERQPLTLDHKKVG